MLDLGHPLSDKSYFTQADVDCHRCAVEKNIRKGGKARGPVPVPPRRHRRKMKVIPLTKKQCEEFVLKKHYSRRASIFWAGFGLEEDGLIVGVCVFGQPSPPIQRHAFKDRDFKLYELARLVVQTSTKNAASKLVAGALAQLDAPCAVVSYADMEQSHCGIIYQATNWIYTGATISHDRMYIVDGVRVHPMSLRDRGITAPGEWAKANNIETVKPHPKHRYFYLVGNKYQKKEMREKLAYPILSAYPKADQRRYDDGPKIYMPNSDAAVDRDLFDLLY